MSVELRLGNCVELAKELDDNSINVTVTSPPYNKCGVGGGLLMFQPGGGGGAGHGNGGGEEMDVAMKEESGSAGGTKRKK